VTKELFAALSDAGEGDKIVLASSGFPAVSMSQQSNATLIRIDSETVPTILEEIMKFIKVINLLRTQQPFASFVRSLCFQKRNKHLLKQINLYFSEKSFQKLVKFIRVTKICAEIG